MCYLWCVYACVRRCKCVSGCVCVVCLCMFVCGVCEYGVCGVMVSVWCVICGV